MIIFIPNNKNKLGIGKPWQNEAFSWPEPKLCTKILRLFYLILLFILIQYFSVPVLSYVFKHITAHLFFVKNQSTLLNITFL